MLAAAGAALAVCSLLLVASATPAIADGSAIDGGGSGFAALEIDQWRADTARKPYSLQVNYIAQGSSVGRANFASGLFDYGASDITFQPQSEPDVMANLKTKRCGGQEPSPSCFVYVPVSAGGLAFMFNVVDNSGRQLTGLKLSRRAVCKIFTGQITRWNDPELVATSPALSALDRGIHFVTRDDGAGESYVLSEFCLAVAPDVWQAFMDMMKSHQDAVGDPVFFQGKPVSKWPYYIPLPNGCGCSQIPASPADSLANTVADPQTGKDSIGYVAAGYAKVRNFPVASVENAAGQFTQPDEENVTVALAYATGRGDGTFVLNFTGGDPRAYFPSTYSYVLAQTGGFDPGKGATLGQFLCYAVGKGQVVAPQLRYARLSTELVGIAVDAITKIPGAPAAGSCVQGAPAAPPPPTVLAVTAPKGPATSGPAATAASAAPKAIGGAKKSAISSQAAAVMAGPGEVAPTGGNGSISLVAGDERSLDGLNDRPAPTAASGQEELAALAEGAAVCGVGLAIASRRRRTAA